MSEAAAQAAQRQVRSVRMTTVDRLLGALLPRPSVTHLTKHDGGWRVAIPGLCARCSSKAIKGWYYCSGCAVELGRR